jgi:hypothetical protein
MISHVDADVRVVGLGVLLEADLEGGLEYKLDETAGKLVAAAVVAVEVRQTMEGVALASN